MNKQVNFDDYEVGYDIPAAIGMDESEIQTPCLILDLDALERNITKMGDYARAHGMRHRVHGKMHKSVDVALLQAIEQLLVRHVPDPHGELVLVVLGALVLYPVVDLSFERNTQHGVVANDVGALFIGSAVGRTPLRPWISPNKSLEGLLGGTILTLVVMLLIGMQDLSDTWSSTSHLLMLAIVISAMAPLGVGKPAITPMGAVIANAVFDAVGVRIKDLPITPERVLAAIREKKGLDLCGQDADDTDAGECIIEE